MPKAAMLAAIALSSTTALLHSAPRHPSQLGAKKRDYSAGGLGSSKQEQFARLWRDKDAPEPPRKRRDRPGKRKSPPLMPLLSSCPTRTGETKVGRPSSRTYPKKAITSDRSVAVAAWDALRGSDGGPYAADDAWLDMDGPARSLILVVAAVS